MKKVIVKTFFAGCLSLSLSFAGFGQVNPISVAEKSDYKSTANYEEVMDFVQQMSRQSKYIRVEALATSTEGRKIPLLVVGNPLPKSPESLRHDKRLVIYVQANIHAGEVEGKEASLMFVRDLLREKDSEILKHVVLLVCPLFNADGNQKISPANRTYQNGPVNGVGVRYNGQFLDLNRDAMKAESPEIRGVITNVFNKWDPAVFMDCHTTDGSYHIEPVTFTWMVNPNGDPSLIHYMRDKMVPSMSDRLRTTYKTENCLYGEFDDLLHPEKGWIYDAAEPRYMTNYVGLRNRLAILDENYVYADYKSRVWGCYHLIRSLAEYGASHDVEIRQLILEADQKSLTRGEHPAAGDSIAVDYKVQPVAEKATIQTYEAELVSEVNGRKNYRRTDRRLTVNVPYYIDYYPVKNVAFPYAYLISVPDQQVLDLLRTHGIRIEQLKKETSMEVEQFVVADIKGAVRLNQGHYVNSIQGKGVMTKMTFPAGTFVVRTAQPLANLVTYLLEPLSNDGLLYWNFLDKYLVPQWGGGYNPYPVYKVLKQQEMITLPYKSEGKS
ncbi:MAG: M14 family metallopeptidase [Marinilabiliales bacterium]|nr:M14 family metallopeptidase [Marinilabiliales bacterium]